jgi:P4 family phage/plasmid primase-like protien
MDTRKLVIARSARVTGRLGNVVENVSVTWDQLKSRLGRYQRTGETLAEYRAMHVNSQREVKDVGGFIGGFFLGTSRRKDELVARSILTFDVDYLDNVFDLETAFAGLAYQAHSTHKHSAAAPRLRLILPLTRDVTVDEYQPIAERIAQRLGLDAFDRVSFRAAQVMFWPSCPADVEPYVKVGEGAWIDPDAVLATYADWKDVAQWPSSKLGDFNSLGVTKVAWAADKPGIIGAFCRAYDIEGAIHAFELPYESTGANRFRFTNGSGGDGVVVYDFGTELFSHHDSDPAGGGQHCRNAWDLVRLHRFGTAADSDQKMRQLAVADAAVVAELEGDRGPVEFEAINGEEVNGTHPGVAPFDTLIAEAALVGGNQREFEALLYRVVTADLSPVQLDLIANALRTAMGATKASVMAALKRAKQRLVANADDAARYNWQTDLTELTLAEHWADGAHLTRTGAHAFWEYLDGCWRLRGEYIIETRIQQTVDRVLYVEAKQNPGLVGVLENKDASTVAGQLLSYLPKLVTNTLLDPMGLAGLSGDSEVINCANGELWFGKGDGGGALFSGHEPGHRLTYQVSTAWRGGSRCPLFMQLIGAQFDVDTQRHLIEWLGYCVQLSRHKPTIGLWHGEPGTGKSTLSHVLMQLMGSENVKRASFAALRRGNNNHFEAGLVSKLMIIDDDFAAGELLPDGLLKTLSEGRVLTANPKGRDEFNFACRAVPLILTNHWPKCADTSGALEDRLQVFDFPHRFRGTDEEDEQLKFRIVADELSGVLRELARGYERLRKRGYWDPSVACKRALSHWRGHSNSFMTWLSEYTRIDPEAKAVTLTAVYRTYQNWHHMAGISGAPLGLPTFRSNLEAQGATISMGHGKQLHTKNLVVADPFDFGVEEVEP